MADPGYIDEYDAKGKTTSARPLTVRQAVANVARRWMQNMANAIAPAIVSAPASPQNQDLVEVEAASILEALSQVARGDEEEDRRRLFNIVSSSRPESVKQAMQRWSADSSTNHIFVMLRDFEMARFVTENGGSIPLQESLAPILRMPEVTVLAHFAWTEAANDVMQYNQFYDWRHRLTSLENWLDWFFFGPNQYWLVMGLNPCPLFEEFMKVFSKMSARGMAEGYLYQYLWQKFGNVKGMWEGKKSGIMQFPAIRVIETRNGKQFNMPIAVQYARYYIGQFEMPPEEQLRYLPAAPEPIRPTGQALRPEELPDAYQLTQAFIECGGATAEALKALLNDTDLGIRDHWDGNVDDDILMALLSLGATHLIGKMNVTPPNFRRHPVAMYQHLEPVTRPDARLWLANTLGLSRNYISLLPPH